MGASQTKEAVDAGQQPIFPHFTTLNDVVTSIMTADGTQLKDSRYAFGRDDQCDNFTVLLESELKKYLKIELMDMKDSIFLIPKKNGAHMGNKTYLKKEELCGTIAKHYNKVLKMLQIVKRIYDLENGGRVSIAGICMRNIVNTPSLIQVYYCGSTQKDYRKKLKKDSNEDDDIAKIDFNEMDGLQMFTKELLSDRERKVFLRNFGSILDRSDRPVFESILSCGDDLLDAKMVAAEVLGGAPGKGIKCDTKAAAVVSKSLDDPETKVTSSMGVAAFNPIFHPQMCFDKLQFIVDKGKISKIEKAKVEGMYKVLVSDYEKQVVKLSTFMKKIVVGVKGGGYELRDLTSDDVTALERELKTLVVIFFYTSLRNYHALLDYVQILNPLNTSVVVEAGLKQQQASPGQIQDGGFTKCVRKSRQYRPKKATPARKTRKA